MNRNILLILVKIALAIPVGFALTYSFLSPTKTGGIFKEMEMLGLPGSIVLTAVFFIAIYFYCRDLQRSLSLVRTSSRKASPRSVWLMLLIPYNFVEDFFIMANVAKSLQQEAQENPALASFKSFGMVTGIGWCAAQIVGILPNEIGSLGSALGLPLWIIHWRLIRKISFALSVAASANTDAKPSL